MSANSFCRFCSYTRKMDIKEPLDIMTMDLNELMPNPSHGPLEVFRKRGSFDWRKLKLLTETEEMLRYKYYLWELMRNDPLFEHTNRTPTVDENKHIVVKQMFAWERKKLLPYEKILKNTLISGAYLEALLLYDGSFLVKSALTFKMYPSAIMAMGTDQQFDKYVKPTLTGEITGCFALTEIAHGSNAKGMRTVATFQEHTREFILNTPDFEAAKCWVGGAGRSATHSVVYAQLISKGQRHGLHAFVVPIRCPITLKPYTGITIGDMGDKLGLNGVDNGFIMFDNYHIPFDSQLARLGGINMEGDYESLLADPARRFGAALGILSSGRVNIGGMSAIYLQKGVTIATRYAAVRRQFSGTSGVTEETPIIEYQSVQTRLMPYLAAAFMMKMFGYWFSEQNFKIVEGLIDDSKYSLAEYGMEVHALSSATKPVCSWLARDGLQMCRELCAGHGYLKSAGIGDIRNDNDANCTYEGENSVLIQQTINWLISIWSRRSGKEIFDTPLKTVYFLKDGDIILQQKQNMKNIEEATKIDNLLDAYKWLVIYLLKSTAQKVESLKQKNGERLKARNNSLSYYGLPAAIAFVEHYLLERTLKIIAAMGTSSETRVLQDLLSLFGAWLLEKHMATLYMGGYWSDSSSGQYLREAIISLCKKLSAEAVLLADVAAPPDFILNSVLGSSDGEVYKNLQKAVFTASEAISRPDWWQDVVNWKAYVPTKL